MSEVLCTQEQLAKGFFPAECEECGWRGCSCELLLEDSCYENDADVYCPKCGSEKIEDTGNFRGEE